jgi:holin-like protein
MLGHLTIILCCQLAGEIIVRMADLPIPGPVVGLLLLFGGLSLRRSVPKNMEAVGGFLHRYLSLLFVPAGVGIISNLDLLGTYWLPLGGAIVLATAVTIGVTGGVMQRLNRRRSTRAGEPAR